MIQFYYSKIRFLLEFFPLFLLSAFLISEQEIHQCALNLSCQLSITIIVSILFFVILYNIDNGRKIAIIFAVLLYISLVYLKHRFITKRI